MCPAGKSISVSVRVVRAGGRGEAKLRGRARDDESCVARAPAGQKAPRPAPPRRTIRSWKPQRQEKHRLSRTHSFASHARTKRNDFLVWRASNTPTTPPNLRFVHILGRRGVVLRICGYKMDENYMPDRSRPLPKVKTPSKIAKITKSAPLIASRRLVEGQPARTKKNKNILEN